MKRLVMLFTALFTTGMVLAQDTAAQPAPVRSFWDDPAHDPMLPLYIVFALMIITIAMIVVVSFYLVKVLNMLVRQAAAERAAKLGIPYVPQPSWFNALWQRMNASVPVHEEQTIEMDHSYDDIRELDNHLPPWWKWLFIVTTIWAVVYFVVFHVIDTMPLQTAEYEQEIAEADAAARAFKASQPVEAIDVNSLAFTEDAAIIQKGKSVFDMNCNSCHRADGGGGIGPNLTDGYWLHGGEIKAIYHTIADGVLDKGMPAWGKTMSPQEVRDVTFFVISLKGTNPANGKAPQGTLYVPAPAAAAADSTASARASATL